LEAAMMMTMRLHSPADEPRSNDEPWPDGGPCPADGAGHPPDPGEPYSFEIKHGSRIPVVHTLGVSDTDAVKNAIDAAGLRWTDRALIGAAVGIKSVLEVNRIGRLAPIVRFLRGLLRHRRYEALVGLRDGQVRRVLLDRL
jgi:hypothetical protein